jgi:hypothetical protein
MAHAPRAARREEEGAVRRLTLLAALAALIACAQQSFPPGGPPRHTAPLLLFVNPESGAVNVKDKSLRLTFDAVISERPAASNAQSLADLVLISPRDGNPRVSWHRTYIDIRGDRAWKPNTAYTITIRPGISDLQNHSIKRSVVFVFSTGPVIPPTVIKGVVFDWATGKPVPNAIVQAYLPPDSTQYITYADSSGRFSLGTLPPGPVNVRGFNDLNSNRALDLREPWDTATVQLTDTTVVDLYAFIHDSLGPHITGLDVKDSLTLHVTFDKPVDTAQKLDTTNFSLHANIDSSLVRIVSVGSWAAYDKARTDSLARADSIAGKRDTAAIRRRATELANAIARDTGPPKLPPPVPKRASPLTEFVIKTAIPLVPGAWYRLEAHDVRNLLGDTATSVRSVQVPKPTPPHDTTKGKAGSHDSTAVAKPPATPVHL